MIYAFGLCCMGIVPAFSSTSSSTITGLHQLCLQCHFFTTNNYTDCKGKKVMIELYLILQAWNFG